MRKLNFYFYIVAISTISVFSSCSKDDETVSTVDTTKTTTTTATEETMTVDFEDVTMDSVLYKASFTNGIMSFVNHYDSTYGSWSGFACSLKTDTITVGYTNGLSVFGTAGASGKKFAVFYYDSYSSATYCNFSDSVARIIKELKVNNTTYDYLAIRDGNDGFGAVTKFTSGNWFKVTITGYNGSTQTGSVDYYLADFRNGKSYICKTWSSVNLESLGKVTKITFTFSSTDNGTNGMNTPAYVCVDDIKYVK